MLLKLHWCRYILIFGKESKNSGITIDQFTWCLPVLLSPVESWLISIFTVSTTTSEPPTANIKPTPVIATANKQPVNPGNKPTPRASIRPMITPAPVPTPTPTATVMPTTQVETQEGRRNCKVLESAFYAKFECKPTIMLPFRDD